MTRIFFRYMRGLVELGGVGACRRFAWYVSAARFDTRFVRFHGRETL